MMTLQEALATGRPFKHKEWSYYISKETVRDYVFYPKDTGDIYEPVWQVQEEEKPPMSKIQAYVLNGDYQEWLPLEKLAAALAPLIKKELNL